MEVQELVSSSHFNFLEDLSSHILKKCTQPGMLSKLDLLSPNVTVQEFYEVDKPQVADKNELINNLVDSFKKLNLEIGLLSENNDNKFENSKSPFKIKDDKNAEILDINKSLPEKPKIIEQKINIEKPSTTTKAKLSKKKRNQEKKKNLELKNLEKKSVEEISDNKMEEIEGEGLTSSQPKIIEENTISKSLGEDTISEDVEEKHEGAKIEEQKTDKKPIMKNLEDKIIKSSKGKGKANVNKNIKAKHGKKDKKEVINKIIKEDDELTRNNELTVFVENNELIDVLKEKKHWKNIRKSNFIIDRTVSLEEAIADIKRIVELWVNDNLEKINKIFFQNKNAFTLISGSYLLNINSVESDVDFIVVLPFNYTDNNGKFVTKIMLDDEFMGSKSECNFDKREECSEKGSLYCVLCESKATSWLRKITTGVSEINATIHNYSFDLAFVAYPWERNSEQILNFIKSEESLNEIDNFILNFTEQFGTNLQFDRFGMINSLSGYRATIRINELIAENKNKFRLVLLTLKLWARNHFIYNGKLGFFSGTSLVILVTKIIVDFNSTKMTIYQILAKFFDVYTYKKINNIDDNSNNKQKIEEHLENELEPISITEETNENIEELREAIDWNETKERESRNKLYINNNEVLRDQIIETQKFLEKAISPYVKQILEKEINGKQLLLEKVLEKNSKMEKHTKLVWPIITPGLPKQNAGFNINMSTRKIIWREMKGAHDFIKTNIKNALKAKSKISKKLDGNHENLKNQWGSLINGGEFKDKYDQFLAIVCTYSSTSEYGDEFCDFSTTRIRLQLLFSIETEIDAICHANLQKPIRDKKQCPKEFRKKGWVCIIWLVGIDFGINGKDKNISSQNLVLEDKENIFSKDKGKQILEEFKEKIISSYLPRKKGVDSFLSKMSKEERDIIMSQLGIEVKYLKKDEVIEWMLN
uniref:polynucleotide adenylyltransferase n=1 Tax=Meloidogyne enterolobii TaxID=390850 RepID=A0A6V7VAS7_MELEN|nr:unnamed protein product [Meloidogyne enterolobii]